MLWASGRIPHELADSAHLNRKGRHLDDQPSINCGPSVVEHFSIHDLYGYKEVSFDSKYAATILIAQNGAGKTTLLGALDAFLKGEFARLMGIPFSRIVCKLAGSDVFVLTRDDLLATTVTPTNADFHGFARRFGLEPDALADFIDNDYLPSRNRARKLHGVETYDLVLRQTDYSATETRKLFDAVAEILSRRSPNAYRVRREVLDILSQTDVAYLPTYRRIELALPEERTTRGARHGRRRESAYQKLGLPKRGLLSAEIQLGLTDISDRLADLNQAMLFDSNSGYREISANIINELIDGSLESGSPPSSNLPDKESLTLFFSRLQEGRRVGQFGDVAIPKIDKFYSGQVPLESNKFLRYFLGKLNTVISATRDVEARVERFVTKCNEYLASPALIGSRDDPQESYTDDKVLKLDKKSLRVFVESSATRRPIQLSALSSGEKQMISLMARLYLYEKSQIILIDEPELSLSMDWQRRLLVDVLAADSCRQVVAITHSPFVFDNELEPYAKSLSVRVRQDLDLDKETESESGEGTDDE
jgi:energy-coupling factor transporter ATP-binding protein EcfA2